jgi:hypothetical protein
MMVISTKSRFIRSLVGVGAAVVTGAATLGGLPAETGIAQAAPSFFPSYHWCPGQFFDPGWGPNWDTNVCHDDFHRDNDGNFHGNDYRGGPPPPDHAEPGNYYVPPGYTGPPPPPGGWQAPPFCVPFVTCPPT